MSSLEKCIFSSLAHFLIGSFIFLELICRSCLCIFYISCLSVASFAIIFSYSEGCLFTLLIVSFAVQSVSSDAQWCPTLCDPMNHSMPGLPVHHQLPNFSQTQVHQVGDAIQPSHLLMPSSPSAFNLWSFSFSISPSNESTLRMRCPLLCRSS